MSTLKRTAWPGFSTRISEPKRSNILYTNVNYGGFNKCIARDTSNGFVLPNCTGYCWGRALETTKSTSVDLSNNQGSVWFSQNKQKWDNGTGGYPYLDFLNKEVSLPGGVKQSGLSTSDMTRLMIIFVMPGNIICYGEGFSPSTGYTYDENGHVQTIEEIWSKTTIGEEYIKYQALSATIFAGITMSSLGITLVNSILKYAFLDPDGTLDPLITNFVTWLMENQRIEIFLNTAKKLGFQALLKYLKGTPYLKLIENLSNDDFFRMIEILENYKYDGWSFYIALCVLLNVLLKKKTLLQVLQKVKLFYNPIYKISESFYSGNTTDHNAWETNFVNLRNEINTVSPIVQGIIMIPPKLSKINNTKSNFPWETIDEYY